MRSVKVTPFAVWHAVRTLPAGAWPYLWVTFGLAGLIGGLQSWFIPTYMPVAVTLPSSAAAAADPSVQPLAVGHSFSSSYFIGVFVFAAVSLLNYYAANRVVAAFDRSEAPTLGFLTAGFLKRVLAPLILLFLCFMVGGLVVGGIIGVLTAIATVSGGWIRTAFSLIGLVAMLAAAFGLILVLLRMVTLFQVIAFEELPFIAAVKRSWALCKGNTRWILLLMVIWILLAFSFKLVVSAVAGLPTALEMADPAKFAEFVSAAQRSIPTLFVVNTISGVIMAAIWWSLCLGIYSALRQGDSEATA